MSIPVVVLGIDTPIGLAIIRDIGSAGVAVFGIARNKAAPGLASRYLTRGMLRAHGESGLIAQLLHLREELGPACLIAISETDITLLNQHRPALSGYTLLFAAAAQMDAALDKQRTYAAAARVGLRVPRTEQVTTLAEAAALSSQLRYPVVLKWANPLHASTCAHGSGLALEKTHYCYDSAQLLAYLRPFSAIKAFPLIQEYCAGYGLGQFVLMKDGQPYASFQHRRVHEWPPEGGFASQCLSLAPEQHQALMAQSVALLRELDWQGVAMVEYRYDPATGEAALMEINGRFWGSLPLAWHAGARFPLWLYQLHGLGQTPTTSPYRSGVRCRFMIPETKRLCRILFAPERIADKGLQYGRLTSLLRYLGDFLHPRSHYYLFAWCDPGPCLRDGAHVIGLVTASLVSRLGWRSSTAARRLP